MGDYRWEWTLPGGAKISATLDPDMRVESVLVGSRVVSQCARGEKPEGHVLAEPKGVVVRFQPGALICILRVDGEEVTPNVWPVRKRTERPKPRVFTLPLRAIAVAAAVLAVGGVAFYAWEHRGGGSDGAPLASTHRAENGRFVTHHPSRFAVRRAQMPAGSSGVVLTDASRGESIVILAYVAADAPTDPWLAHKKLHGEALANLPRSGPAWEDVSRSDETCVGRAGAASTGRSTTPKGDPATVWSCAFVNDGAAYLAMVSLPESGTSEDAKELRAIVDATELTHLTELETK